MAFEQSFNKLKLQEELVYSTETISADGAASLSVPVSLVTGTIAVSLADTTKVGLIKIFVQTGAGTCTLTPATFNGGTTIALSGVGETVTLMWSGSVGWSIISSSLSASAAITNSVLTPIVA